MISAPDLSQAQLDSPLGRTSPVVKLAVAIDWLVALAFTLEPLPPVAVAVLALGAGMWLGQIPIPDLARALAPLWLAALVTGRSSTIQPSSSSMIRSATCSTKRRSWVAANRQIPVSSRSRMISTSAS